MPAWAPGQEAIMEGQKAKGIRGHVVYFLSACRNKVSKTNSIITLGRVGFYTGSLHVYGTSLKNPWVNGHVLPMRMVH